MAAAVAHPRGAIEALLDQDAGVAQAGLDVGSGDEPAVVVEAQRVVGRDLAFEAVAENGVERQGPERAVSIMGASRGDCEALDPEREELLAEETVGLFDRAGACDAHFLDQPVLQSDDAGWRAPVPGKRRREIPSPCATGRPNPGS